MQQADPSDSLAAGEPQGHSGHGLNRPFAFPSITSPGNAVIVLASALPLKLERVYWVDGAKLVVPLGGGEPDPCAIVSYTNTHPEI